MSYEIDSSPVNSRADWHHVRNPTAPQGRREEQFPGIPERFGVVGLAMPPDLLVEGYLEASGADKSSVYTSLHNQIDGFEQMQGDGATHKVTVQGVDFDDCILLSLNSPGPSQAARLGTEAPGAVRVRLPVRFLWRQLKRSS